MSLPGSRPPQTLADHYEALRGTLIEVAECSFSAIVGRSDEEHFREVAKRVELWIGASVLFEAALAGAVLVVMPETLARDLFQASIGAERGVVAMDARLFDLVGEFTNMVCGGWLARTVNHHYALRPPEDLASAARTGHARSRLSVGDDQQAALPGAAGVPQRSGVGRR